MSSYKRPIIIALICGILLIALMTSGCTQNSQSTPETMKNTSITFTDSNGNVVALPSTVNRIVSTNAECTEILIGIEVKDKIVGVTDYVAKNSIFTDVLPKNVTNIGSFQTPNVEQIVSLKPDIVICYASSQNQKNVNQIIAANITVVYLDCYKLDNLSSDVKTLGRITGNTKQADDYDQFVDHYLDLVKNRTGNLSTADRPPVYWESYYSLTTAGKDSMGDTMINLARGRNIAGDNPLSSAKVDAEWVIDQDPTYIIKQFQSTLVNTTASADNITSEIKSRPGFSNITAVKYNYIYTISDNMQGGRNVIMLLYLAKTLHPELFKDIDPTQVQAQYAEKFLPGADQGIYLYPSYPQ